MNQEEIKKQAKEIIDNFARALEKVKVEEVRVKREEDRRQEKEGQGASSDFRKIMFENFRNKDISDSARKSIKDFRHAPEKEGECIKAEKGGWVE